MVKDFDEEEDYETDDSYQPEQDIPGVCSALRRAWSLLPDKPLHEVLDIALPSTITEMTDEEMIEALEEFIHQNQ